MGFFIVFLLLAGGLQLWAGIAAVRAKGELKTTQGRQLDAALGRKGTIAFFFVLATLLIGGALLQIVRALSHS